MSATKTRVIVAGNPGVGKSTILNTFIGSIEFRSGISVGTGMTKVLQEVETDDYIYADTPGLDDHRTREQAAKEISTALRRGGNIKLIFVITLESGRLRPADIVTMEHILDAITEVNVDVNQKFLVVINKMSKKVLQAIEKDIDIFFSQVTQKYVVGVADFLMEDDAVKNEDDMMFPDRRPAKQILREAPVMSVKEGAPITVNTKNFPQLLEEKEAEMRQLREDAERRERFIMEMQEAETARRRAANLPEYAGSSAGPSAIGTEASSSRNVGKRRGGKRGFLAGVGVTLGTGALAAAATVGCTIQ